MTEAMPVHTRRLAAALSLVAAMTLTGANVAFGKAIVAAVPVYAFVFFRFLLASAALLLIVRGEGGPKLSAMTWGERRDLLLMSLLGMVGFTVLMFEGLKLTAAADAGIITATLPAAAALLGVLVMGDRLSRLQGVAIALAVTGLVLVQAVGAGTGTSSLVGNLLVGGAVLCEASFVLLGKRLAPPYRPLRLALGANLVGLALSVPLALATAESFDWQSVPLSIWLLGTWHALTASVVCLWLWYRGLPHVETWLAGLATAAVPVAALAASVLFLGESIGGWKLIGDALVVAAIVLGAMAPSARGGSADKAGPL
jgi:drug/metabolite transporter (DMT)-like permease